jgi:hypothetical protein
LLLRGERIVGEFDCVLGRERLIPRLEGLLNLAIVVDVAADGQLRSELGERFFELGALLGASLV